MTDLTERGNATEPHLKRAEMRERRGMGDLFIDGLGGLVGLTAQGWA
jgi:hypothetical protein